MIIYKIIERTKYDESQMEWLFLHKERAQKFIQGKIEADNWQPYYEGWILDTPQATFYLDLEEVEVIE